MSENRVIGRDNQLPWHLPEDFRWFKQTTLGHTLVMGRKTYESIGRPLPGRLTLVLSRTQAHLAGVTLLPDLDALRQYPAQGQVFICGGASLYAQTLPECSDLYLTLVHQHLDGDAHFPPFEHLFQKPRVLQQTKDFTIHHYIKGPS